MNANDLIHVLENSNNTEPFLFKEAATMLRQLQAENEALKHRELTDSEIEQISHRYHYTYNPDYIGFAREILKEAKKK